MVIKDIAKNVTGVYVITNNVNHKNYVGSSSNCIRGRIYSHFNALTKNKHGNSILQRCFNKYGQASFTYKIIAICPKIYCIKLEQWFIDNLQPDLNISKTAGSILGCKRSTEAKNATRLHMIGRKVSDETRHRLRISHLGKKISAEQIKKMREKQKGKYVSPETGRKISKSKTGIPRDEATKQKLRLKSMGNKNMIGFKFSIESIAKMSNSHLGIKQSKETIEKIRMAQLNIRMVEGYKDPSCTNIYKIILPNGCIEEVANAKSFALKNNISITSLQRTVATGKAHKGYQILSVEKNHTLRFVS